MNSTEMTITAEQAKAIRAIIEREQDRVVLRLLSADTEDLIRPHLERYLSETRIALQAFG